MQPAAKQTTDCRGFLPIAVDTLVPTPALDFDLFLKSGPSEPVVMYRERAYPLERSDLDRLAEGGLQTLYITVASHTAYRRFLRETVIENTDLTPTQRYKVLRLANQAVFERSFRNGSVDQMLEFADDFGQHAVDIICNRALVLTSILPLMAHDYYTYTHVTNVCTYCLALAHHLGIDQKQDLLAIATGALLHDVGKRHISPSILNHPGPLDDKQWEIMRNHPTAGFKDLCMREDLSWEQLMMVYQHHERMNGRGYPVCLTGSEIHPWARMCMVADVFDALSSARPYRGAKPIGEVLSFLEDRSGTEFDKEMVQCLISMIGRKN